MSQFVTVLFVTSFVLDLLSQLLKSSNSETQEEVVVEDIEDGREMSANEETR